MKIIMKPRGQGKTADLVRLSSEAGFPILLWLRDRYPTYKGCAEKLDIEIPEPIPFMRGIRIGSPVMIDDLDGFLFSLIGAPVRVATVTGPYKYKKSDIARQLGLNESDFEVVDD